MEIYDHNYTELTIANPIDLNIDTNNPRKFKSPFFIAARDSNYDAVYAMLNHDNHRIFGDRPYRVNISDIQSIFNEFTRLNELNTNNPEDFITELNSTRIAYLDITNLTTLVQNVFNNVDYVRMLNAYVDNMIRNASDKRKTLFFQRMYALFANNKGIPDNVVITALKMNPSINDARLNDIYRRVSRRYNRQTRNYANVIASLGENREEVNRIQRIQRENNKYMNTAMIAVRDKKMGLEFNKAHLNGVQLLNEDAKKLDEFRGQMQRSFNDKCTVVVRDHTDVGSSIKEYIEILSLARTLNMMDYMFVPKVTSHGSDSRDTYTYKKDGHETYTASLLMVLNDTSEQKGGGSEEHFMTIFERVYDYIEGNASRVSEEYFELKILYAKLLPLFSRISKTKKEGPIKRDLMIGGDGSEADRTKMMLAGLLWNNPLDYDSASGLTGDKLQKFQMWFHVNMIVLDLIWEEFFDEKGKPYAGFYDVLMESTTFRAFLEFLMDTPYRNFKPSKNKSELMFCDPKHYLRRYFYGDEDKGIDGIFDRLEIRDAENIVNAIQYQRTADNGLTPMEPLVSAEDIYSNADKVYEKIKKKMDQHNNVRDAIEKLRGVFDDIGGYREFYNDDEIAPIVGTKDDTGKLCTIMIVHLLNLIVDENMVLRLSGNEQVLKDVYDWYYGLKSDVNTGKDIADEKTGVVYILGHFVKSYRMVLKRFAASRGRVAGRAMPMEELERRVTALERDIAKIDDDILKQEAELKKKKKELDDLNKKWEECLGRYGSEQKARLKCKGVWDRKVAKEKEIEEIEKKIAKLMEHRSKKVGELKEARRELYKKQVGLKGDLQDKEDEWFLKADEAADLMEELEEYKQELKRLNEASVECRKELQELHKRARLLEKQGAIAELGEVNVAMKEKEEECEKIKRKIDDVGKKIKILKELQEKLKDEESSGEDKMDAIKRARDEIKRIDESKREELEKDKVDADKLHEFRSVFADGTPLYQYPDIYEKFEEYNKSDHDPKRKYELFNEINEMLGSPERALENLIGLLQGKHTSMMLKNGVRNSGELFDYAKYLNAVDGMREGGKKYVDMKKLKELVEEMRTGGIDTSNITDRLDKIEHILGKINSQGVGVDNTEVTPNEPVEQNDDDGLILLMDDDSISGGTRKSHGGMRRRTMKNHVGGMRHKRISYSVGEGGELLRTTVGGYLKQKGGLLGVEGLFRQKKPSKTVIVDKEKFLADLRKLLSATSVENEEMSQSDNSAKTEAEKISDALYNKRYAELLELLKLSLKFQQHRYIPGYLTDLFNMVSQMHEMAVTKNNYNRQKYPDMLSGGGGLFSRDNAGRKNRDVKFDTIVSSESIGKGDEGRRRPDDERRRDDRYEEKYPERRRVDERREYDEIHYKGYERRWDGDEDKRRRWDEDEDKRRRWDDRRLPERRRYEDEVSDEERRYDRYDVRSKEYENDRMRRRRQERREKPYERHWYDERFEGDERRPRDRDERRWYEGDDRRYDERFEGDERRHKGYENDRMHRRRRERRERRYDEDNLRDREYRTSRY